MKKGKYLLLLVLFAIISTGCVKFNANIDIKKDKSMEFSIIYAFDKSLMGESNSLKEEDMAEPKKCGFEVTKYSEGNYEGFKLVKKVANIDDVSSEQDVTYNLSGMTEEGVCDGKMFKVTKTEAKNTYVAKFKFDANSSNMTDDTEEETNEVANPDEEMVAGDDDTLDVTSDDSSNLDLSGLMSNLDLSFNVTLPYGAVSSNATTKEDDNKKLSWKLGTSGEQLIEFTFELKNNEKDSSMLLYIGIGAAVLILIIVILLIMSKKKKNPEPVAVDNKVEVKDEAPVSEVNENVVPEPKQE